MNKPKKIVIHCSATKEGNDLDIDNIRSMHKARGFNDVGYHYIIKLNGVIQYGRKQWVKGAHAKTGGNNTDTIGICYIGGLDSAMNPKDTRTPQQIAALERLVRALILTNDSITEVVGHRDLSPDLDGDGVIESHEWLKQCPCFDVVEWYESIMNC